MGARARMAPRAQTRTVTSGAVRAPRTAGTCTWSRSRSIRRSLRRSRVGGGAVRGGVNRAVNRCPRVEGKPVPPPRAPPPCPKCPNLCRAGVGGSLTVLRCCFVRTREPCPLPSNPSNPKQPQGRGLKPPSPPKQKKNACDFERLGRVGLGGGLPMGPVPVGHSGPSRGPEAPLAQIGDRPKDTPPPRGGVLGGGVVRGGPRPRGPRGRWRRSGR